MKLQKKSLKKAVYPSKTKLNLAMKEKSPFRPSRLIPALILILAATVLFSKFAVADRISAVSAAEVRLEALQQEKLALQQATANFRDLTKEYAHYASDWMTEDQRATVPLGEVLDVVEQQLLPHGRILSIETDVDVLSIFVDHLDLQVTSQLVETLSALPTVTDVQVYTAESERPSKRETTVNFLITMIPAADVAEGGEPQ